MHPLILALSILAPAPKPPEPQVATVSLSMSGAERNLAGPLGTQWEGIGLAMLGSSSVVSDKTQADWEAVGKGDHLRVHFPSPRALRARGDPKDATYEVGTLDPDGRLEHQGCSSAAGTSSMRAASTTGRCGSPSIERSCRFHDPGWSARTFR